MAMQNSPARSSIDVGSVIAGTYTIEALIGRGGMGAVFLASHNRLPGKKVAIKVLHADLGGDEILARFKREAQIASLLSHPNIVHIEDYNVTGEGMPYLVLEYLQGESLAQRLGHGPLSVDAVFPIIRQVGSALAAAHAKGIVHRDLKPQNIFLMPSEIDGRSGEIAKVLDFGISKMRDSQTVKTQDTALLGTPQYMAPEQATGQHDKVDERTDVFALGSIVYEMLSGQPAFSGQTIPEVVFKVVYEQPIPLATRAPSLSTQIVSAVERALAKKAEERFASVNDFLQALTGSPVSVIRNAPSLPPSTIDASGPTSASASGRSSVAHHPNTGREAFDQTMASGEHGPSPLAGTVADGRVGPANVPVDAITVQSFDGRPAPRPPADRPDALSSTVASSERPLDVDDSARRTPLILGGVLVAAVAAAGIAYFALREPPRPPASASVERDVVQAPPSRPRDVPQIEKDLMAARTPDDASGGAASPGSAVADGSATQPTKGKKEKDAPGTEGKTAKGKVAEVQTLDPIPPPRASVDEEPDAKDDTRAGVKLRQAFAALGSGNWHKAGEDATAAMTSEDVRPKQARQAKMILGVVACHTNDGAGAGQTMIRALDGYPNLQARIREACRQARKAAD